jgi:hypothetical protein
MNHIIGGVTMIGDGKSGVIEADGILKDGMLRPGLE